MLDYKGDSMYKLIGTHSVQRLSDNAFIPLVDGNTDYEEYKQWVAEGNIPEPEFTEEELVTKELRAKIQEANQYLAQTDWVNSYKIRHDLGLELIPEDSQKWLVINKREEYITFLKGVN